MDDKEALVKNWLIKAQHDLLAAKKLSVGQEVYMDVAIYHCQQACEKAVKGFLVLYNQEFPKHMTFGCLFNWQSGSTRISGNTTKPRRY